MVTTPNIGLKTFNRPQNAQIMSVGEWIDDINGEKDSNMTKIDEASGQLRKRASLIKRSLSATVKPALLRLAIIRIILPHLFSYMMPTKSSRYIHV